RFVAYRSLADDGGICERSGGDGDAWFHRRAGRGLHPLLRAHGGKLWIQRPSRLGQPEFHAGSGAIGCGARRTCGLGAAAAASLVIPAGLFAGFFSNLSRPWRERLVLLAVRGPVRAFPPSISWQSR